VNNLRIGIPSKGRLADLTADLLDQAGLSFRRQDRTLFARASEMPIDITFVRSDDIPVLCAEGAIDVGITAGDMIEEAGVELTTRLSLGIGKCRMEVCVPEDKPEKEWKQFDGLRVATSFPRLAEKFFKDHGADVHLVPVSGSVEIMISLGVADAIVDVVQTGSTLAANQLKVIAEIGKYETMLVQNSNPRDPETADRVVRRIEGVVIARSWSLLEYNIQRTKLAAAEEITPGFNSPTVNTLEDAEWCAVEVMVKRKDVIAVMDKLEAIGATAILETRITNTRL
jgi:ATP phosphoribosyltransferase